MPTLPWSRLGEPEGTAVVMASEFQLKSLGSVPRFFIDSMRIRKQLLSADGALGVSLIAKPFGRRFYTLSAWRDRASIDTFIRKEPHKSAMRRYRPVMERAAFIFWETDQLPVNWDDARRRLANAPEKSG